MALRFAPDAVVARLAGDGSLARWLAAPNGLDRWTGAVGEELAARALAREGFELLGRNVDAPEGELDLLAREGDALVVVEVKCGRAPHAPAPPHAADREWRPLDRIRPGSVAERRRAAARIARRAGGAPRVDVIEVLLDGTGGVRVERFADVHADAPAPWRRRGTPF